MKSLKAKIFYTLNNDPTIRSLLGLPPLLVDPNTHLVIPALPADAKNKINWFDLPTNPEYPCITFRRITTKNELKFKGMKTIISEVYFEIYVYTDKPTPELVDDVKDRVTILFQDTQDSLSDSYMIYFLSEVTDDSGDVFLDEDMRYYSTLRIRFKVQKVCDAVASM
jgi:hypothetical protein